MTEFNLYSLDSVQLLQTTGQVSNAAVKYILHITG